MAKVYREVKEHYLGQLILTKESRHWSYTQYQKALKAKFGSGIRKQYALRLIKATRQSLAKAEPLQFTDHPMTRGKLGRIGKRKVTKFAYSVERFPHTGKYDVFVELSFPGKKKPVLQPVKSPEARGLPKRMKGIRINLGAMSRDQWHNRVSSGWVKSQIDSKLRAYFGYVPDYDREVLDWRAGGRGKRWTGEA